MANKRTYTKRTTAAPKAEETPKPIQAEDISAPEPVEPSKKTVSDFKPNDLIPCKSITAGKMIYIGPRTKTPYVWANAGDVAYLEYQDLMSAILAHSDYVYSPNFVIEEDVILDDRRWSELKDLYATLFDAGDVKAMLKLPLSQFKSELKKAPRGLQNAVKAEMSSGIKDGTFDSIQKVKAADEVLGTKMAELMA